MLRHGVLAGLGALACLVLLAGPAPAQTDPNSAAQAFGVLVDAWNRNMVWAEQTLERDSITREDLYVARRRLETVRDQALEIGAQARANLDTAQKLIKALGPPPESGTEAEGVAEQRAKLTQTLAFQESRVKQSELTATRANELLRTISQRRRAQMAERFFDRAPSPLFPGVWVRSVSGMVQAVRDADSAFRDWYAAADTREQLAALLPSLAVSLIAAIAVGLLLRAYLLRHFGIRRDIEHPSSAQRLFALLVEGVARSLLPTAIALLVYFALADRDLLAGSALRVAMVVVSSVIFVALSTSLARAALAPAAPAWRVAPVGDDNAARLASLAIGLALVMAANGVLGSFSRALGTTLELQSTVNLITGLIVAALIVAITHPRLWAPAVAAPTAEGEAPPPSRLQRYRPLILLAALSIPAAAAAGYYMLAQVIAVRLVVTTEVFLILWLLHELVRAGLHLLATRDTGLTRRLRDVLALGDRGTLAVQFWTVAIADLALLVGGALVLLRLWGMEWQEARDWFYRVLFDLRIGNVSLSFSDIATAILLFVALLIGTRFLQRVLDQRILPQTQLDIGVRNSLRAATGYVGIIIAVLVAFTALGLDFTQLALIAGALSVGIGFGLQNIVNNFVSGLILLIERPIKVGDWVIVGDKQGFVKQINVRSTEIETFERSTVIVPNSDLIQQPVVNWTYKDKYGRIDVRVGVAYGSDTEKVREILLACARAHTDVARYPEPNVLFRDFGNSSLDFELRVYVRDVSASYLKVSSDLRFAVDAAFREAGVQIPFPQQDLHIKDAAPLTEALRAAREQPERPAARVRRKPAAE